MKIETKFDVNNLVVSKYHRHTQVNGVKGSMLACFEVIDVNTGTCMAGTQIFYLCRAIIGIVETDYSSTPPKKKIVQFEMGSLKDCSTEYQKFREDELIPAPQETIDMVLAVT